MKRGRFPSRNRPRSAVREGGRGGDGEYNETGNAENGLFENDADEENELDREREHPES